MFRRHSPNVDDLRCSFCHKSQDVVQKLISSPSDYPRAYICEECINVCVAILQDDRDPPDVSVSEDESNELNPVLSHDDRLTQQLLAAVERWIRQESLGADASAAFAEVRAIAIRWMRSGAQE